MTPPITFELVNTEERWSELELFAASFDHKIDRTSLTPLIAMKRGGKMFGYYFVLAFPIVFPCFHPEHTSKRDFVDAVNQVRAAHWQRTLGNDRFPHGVCFAAFDKEPVIDAALIEKLGFHRTNCELWRSHPEAIK